MTTSQAVTRAMQEPAAMAGGGRAVLLFGGDFCPVGRYERKLLAGEPLFDDTIVALFRQSDVTIVNLEAPLCAAGLPAASPGGSGLRADPRVAEAMRNLGIGVAGLANNHILDFRDEGVRQTLQHLKANGIPGTGAGMNLDEAQQPLTLDVNGMRVGLWALAEKELNVASATSAGSSWFRPFEDAIRIRDMRAGFDFLVVYLHAGHEFTHTPSPRIRTACRNLVDAGADAVIAHHPHVAQGVEPYKGGWIAYSLGNLVFDTPYVSAYKDTDTGYLVRLSVSPHAIHKAEFLPYRQDRGTVVTLLTGAEREAFDRRLHELSANITDEARFERAWEENVRFRWETEYRRILTDFSRHFTDPRNRDYAYRSRNLFACPTHTEMLEKIFLMLEQGKLKREDMQS